ncbi:permease [Antrihabitans cavernicola]|uniref:Permease n=1 Tax=Antrihabitans cavernicola TaxID=2495913 RepID=A0A5A7S797_9NOCA|nr:permease [Spelaeibacter cavernicola]KAA0021049.1 permease [Spelaeibacter cavernicola]
MTLHSEDRATTVKAGMASWLKRLIAIAIIVVILVITYFILAAFIPRWWAQRAGRMSDGSFAKGIAWGSIWGGASTLIPLLLLLVAGLVFRKRGGKVIAGLAALLALAAAVPNLMTLVVVLGNNDAAHAGERIMDVDAPGFRGASLIAAIVAALIFLGIAFLVAKYKRRGSQLKKARNAEQERELERERVQEAARDHDLDSRTNL